MHRIFVYGTLKRGFPNNYLLTSIKDGQMNYIGNAVTSDCFPLIVGSRFHIPFMLSAKGEGKVCLCMAIHFFVIIFCFYLKKKCYAHYVFCYTSCLLIHVHVVAYMNCCNVVVVVVAFTYLFFLCSLILACAW